MNYLKKMMKIELLTGLHIGGNKDDFEIGGTDLPVIKIRKSGSKDSVPYIPGSSLKGKMRSLLEISRGKSDVCSCGECEICVVFGSTGKEGKDGKRVGALIVRDFYLENDSDYVEEKFLELKTENTVERVTGKAKNPRFVERVVPGTVFKGEIVLRIFDETKSEQCKKTVDEALEMLQKDYLGGCGTRGYGQIKIIAEDWK